MDVGQLPTYYKAYSWSDKHSLFGHPPDTYPAFEWIRSLERRFLWYRQNPGAAPLYLVREMIQWGGSQNGVLEKFDDALGSYCLTTALTAVLERIEEPRAAIEAALRIPGFGLTYASKLLRFVQPERYGALDRRIRTALSRLQPPLPDIYDGNTRSMVQGYCAFIDYLAGLREALEAGGIALPAEDEAQALWRPAEIEMALFQWASTENDGTLSNPALQATAQERAAPERPSGSADGGAGLNFPWIGPVDRMQGATMNTSITLPFGGSEAKFDVVKLVEHIKDSGRDYIIQGQINCALSVHRKPRSLDVWLRRNFAANHDAKQAVNDVIDQLVSTGLFEVGQFRCPDSGRSCKGIKLVKKARRLT